MESRANDLARFAAMLVVELQPTLLAATDLAAKQATTKKQNGCDSALGLISRISRHSNSSLKKAEKNTQCGDRTHDHTIKSRALYRLS